MRLSLITVSYNSTEEVTRLLESLDKQTDSSFEMIVVDNNSKPHELTKLERTISDNFSWVKLIKNSENLGFAAANNIALAKVFQEAASAEAGWAFLINPDTWVENDFIARLKGVLGPLNGLVGVTIDEGGRTIYGGLVKWLKPTLSHITNPENLKSQESYVVGAAMAISRDVYQKIGGLDEKYFLYFEDADYSLKAQRAGFPITITDDVVIHHEVSSVTKKMGSPFLFYYHYQSALRFNYKNGPIWIKILIFFWSIAIALKQWVKILINREGEISRAILDGVKKFYGLKPKVLKTTAGRLKIGIECENLEDDNSRWGVGQVVIKLIEAYVATPEWQDKYELHLFFKSHIPNDSVLKNPVLKKHIVGGRFFNIYYHIALPIRAMFMNLNWMFFPAYMLPPLYLKKSIVMLTEDVYYEYKNGQLPFRYRLAYGLFTNWSAIKATKILAISESSKKEVAKLYRINPDRIITSLLGTDTHAKSERINTRGRYILYVGQMFPRRSALECIRAFRHVAKNNLGLKLILVGKDKYQPSQIDDEIQNINREFGSERVIHFEYVKTEDLQELYSHAELFTYISSREAFGLPPVEAASYGVPVVVKDNPLNHELFGDSAFFVKNEKDVHEIAQIMEEGIGNIERRRKIIEQYPKIIPRLNWHDFAKRFFNSLT